MEKEIVIQCVCKLSKLHLRHLQWEPGNMSWKKPQQAEFGSGHIFLSVSNGESEREWRPSLDRSQHSFSEPAETVTGLSTQIGSRVTCFYGDCLFAGGFECVAEREIHFSFISASSRFSK